MTPPDLSTRRRWTKALSIDPLAADDPRYVEIIPPEEAMIAELEAQITATDPEDASVHLVSGPRGSGKSTELNRLRKHLENDGYTVLLVDALDYISQSSPLDITQFLVAFGLSFADQCDEVSSHRRRSGDPNAEPATDEQDRFRDRFVRFLRRVNVDLDIAGVGVHASADGVGVEAAGQSLKIDLKRELRSSPDFAQRLRDQLGFHLGDLRREVAEYCEERSKAISPDGSVVMIIDSLEKLRGTRESDKSVQDSVQGLFVNHCEKLRFERMHVIYTVPSYLSLVNPAFAVLLGTKVRVVPTPKLCERNATEPAPARREPFREVIRRRVEVDTLFANEAALDGLIDKSGGNLRDLLRLMNELLTIVAARRITLPVDHVVTTLAIRALEHDYRFTREDAEFLLRIRANRGTLDAAEDEIARFARLLDTEIVLAHTNGETWYEVHPLAIPALEALPVHPAGDAAAR